MEFNIPPYVSPASLAVPKKAFVVWRKGEVAVAPVGVFESKAAAALAIYELPEWGKDNFEITELEFKK